MSKADRDSFAKNNGKKNLEKSRKYLGFLSVLKSWNPVKIPVIVSGREHI